MALSGLILAEHSRYVNRNLHIYNAIIALRQDLKIGMADLPAQDLSGTLLVVQRSHYLGRPIWSLGT